MSSQSELEAPILIWQGFNHEWQYNHRANRMGSYIEHKSRSSGSCEADVVHTAASGTGPDTVESTDLYTAIRARGVEFHPGVCEIKLITVEDRDTRFFVVVEIAASPELLEKTDYSVLLNGFDLIADDDADKLMGFLLEVTEVKRDHSRQTITFLLRGTFRVDCSTPECDRKVRRIRKEYNHTFHESAFLLNMALEQSYEEAAKDQLPRYKEGGKPVVINRVEPPLKRHVYYTLLVHYVVVGGDRESLHTTESEYIVHEYKWDTKREISDVVMGRRPLLGREVLVGDTTGDYGGGLVAFKQIAIQLKREQRNTLFRRAKAMHLLEWNTAITNVETLKPGIVTCRLDLFFKNWRKGMTKAHPWQSYFALRDAGEAQFGVQLLLLQFKDVDLFRPGDYTQSFFWSPPRGDAAVPLRDNPDSKAADHVQIA